MDWTSDARGILGRSTGAHDSVDLFPDVDHLLLGRQTVADHVGLEHLGSKRAAESAPRQFRTTGAKLGTGPQTLPERFSWQAALGDSMAALVPTEG